MISLAGLSTSTLLTLGVIGLSVISLLYFLRLRRRQVIVPFLPLWKRVVQQSQYQSLIQRLKRLISWLIQLLFWGLLLLALADPRLRAELLSGRTIVLLVDTSASMAVREGSTNRLEIAKSQASSLIRSLIGNDRLMLIAMDKDIVPLSPFTSDQDLLLRRLRSLHTTETSADLRRGLLLAQDALRDQKRPEIVVISDAAFGPQYADLLKPLADEAPDPDAAPLERLPPNIRLLPEGPASPPTANPKAPTPPTDRASPPSDQPSEPSPETPPSERPDDEPLTKGKKAGSKGSKRSKDSKRSKGKKSKKSKKGRPLLKGKKGKTKGTLNGKKAETTAPSVGTADLPPGLDKTIDLKTFSNLSESQRKLPPFRLISVGKSRDNVGLVALSARRLPDHPLHFSVYLEVQNFSAQAIEGFLELYVNDLIIASVGLSLQPRERWPKTFPRLIAQGQRLEARLRLTKGKDDFPTDDKAYAVLPKLRPPSVLLVSDDNLYLHAALLSDPQIIYRSIACKAWPPSQMAVDVVIFSGCVPDSLPEEGRFIFVDPPEDKTPFAISRQEKRMLKNPIITEERETHPTMQFVALRDVNLASAVEIRPLPTDVVLASSFGKPLIVARETPKRRLLVIGFSLKQTDLPLRVAWPIFLRNGLQWLIRGGRPEPPTTYQTGQNWPFEVPPEIKTLTFEAPQKTPMILPVQQGQAILTGKQTGFYRIVFGKTEQWIAANLADPDESTIRPREISEGWLQTAKKEADLPPPPTEFVLAGWKIPIPQPIWLWLVFVALLLLSLEWWTYNRRITV